MRQHVDLLKGNITTALGKLSIPIMATSFIQMAYNMIDMIWLGKVGSGAVAAVGAAGMYMWLSNGLATLAKMGGQVKVGQSLGAQNYDDARMYSKGALQLGIVFALACGVLTLFAADQMIGFFRLNQASVIQDAIIYLQITCGLVVFNFMNQILTGILTAMGNSRSSFVATSIGLLINLVLDPLFIFGFGMIPAMGVAGAAIATVLAQFETLRERIPGLVLRTSLITGLPGEGETEFMQLCQFLKRAKLERVGAFPFSPEEGTPAARMEHPDAETAQARAEIVEELQSRMMDRYNESLLGKTMEVLCDGYDPEEDRYYGRTYADSPEIDGRVWFTADRTVRTGSFCQVRMTGTQGGELIGREEM